MIGSAAALGPDDIITCQHRETGVFKQRGFALKDFMSQLMHNKNDPGKGRNMPVHYSGRLKTGAVSLDLRAERRESGLTIMPLACRGINIGNSNPSCSRSRICNEARGSGNE